MSMNAGSILEQYKKYCYIIGRELDRSPNPSIARMLYQVDAEMTPGMFMSLWIITTLLAAAAMLCAGLILFIAPFSPFRIEQPLLYILMFPAIGMGGVGLGFPFYLQTQISNKKMDIERKLPYALSFMSILASSGQPRSTSSAGLQGRITGISPTSSRRSSSGPICSGKTW